MFIQFISNFLIDAVYYILSVSRKSERVGISVWDTLRFQISCKEVLKRKEKKKKCCDMQTSFTSPETN